MIFLPLQNFFFRLHIEIEVKSVQSSVLSLFTSSRRWLSSSSTSTVSISLCVHINMLCDAYLMVWDYKTSHLVNQQSTASYWLRFTQFDYVISRSSRNSMAFLLFCNFMFSSVKYFVEFTMMENICAFLQLRSSSINLDRQRISSQWFEYEIFTTHVVKLRCRRTRSKESLTQHWKSGWMCCAAAGSTSPISRDPLAQAQAQRKDVMF